jgi:hypothetical protein
MTQSDLREGVNLAEDDLIFTKYDGDAAATTRDEP